MVDSLLSNQCCFSPLPLRCVERSQYQIIYSQQLFPGWLHRVFIYMLANNRKVSQNFSETDAQTWGRAGSTSCNCFLGAQPPWTVAVSMRPFGSKRYCKWMNSYALVVELTVPEDWDTGENMSKMMVASASAGAGSKSGWSCTVK